MLHLPIAENRIAQFAARFEPVGDGYAWHGDARQGGLPVSAAERAQMIADYARVQRRTFRFMGLWAILSGVALGVLDASSVLMLARWQQMAVVLAPAPLVLALLWRAERAPMAMLGTRMPITPPRPRMRAMAVRLAALPLGISVSMIGIGALLIVQLWRRDEMATTPGYALIGLGSIAFGTAILIVRRRVAR